MENESYPEIIDYVGCRDAIINELRKRKLDYGFFQENVTPKEYYIRLMSGTLPLGRYSKPSLIKRIFYGLFSPIAIIYLIKEKFW